MAQQRPIEWVAPVVSVTAGLVGIWWIVQQHKHQHNPGREGESCKASSHCGPGLGCVSDVCMKR